MRKIAQKTTTILSPLRYPGGKRRLAGYIAEILRRNSLRPKLFVEPFAGGLSVALQLLNNNLVDSIAIGEKDPLVASFWKVVFNDTDWLIEQIKDIEVTVENWQYFRENSLKTNREKALACLFLNRTSFSGILAKTAGPLGGYSQKSKYKINCRFNIQTIVKRITQAAKLNDKVIFIENNCWQKTLRKVEKLGFAPKEVTYYLDPPFYNKANRLYRHYFEEGDHIRLHDAIMELQYPWILLNLA